MRDSNAELLRIVCMLMIVCHHYTSHSFFTNVLSNSYQTSLQCIILFLHCFVLVGVNCFILISGYYGVKLRVHSFTNLIICCVIYIALGIVVRLACQNLSPEGEVATLLEQVFFVKKTGWWFITCYLALLVVSPILNIARNFFSKSQYQMVLILMTGGTLVFGWLLSIYGFDKNGYSTAQLVYFYMVGGYLKKYVDIDRWRWRWLALYVVSSLLWGVCSLVFHEWKGICYNNPFVLLASLGLFGFVMSFHFQNRVVNWIASSCLAVYIVQERYIYYKGVASVFDQYQEWQLVLWLVPLTLVTFVVVVLFDKLRMLIQHPINIRIDAWLSALIKTIRNKMDKVSA